MSTREYNSFKDFYPFYLKEHSNKMNKVLHFTGTSILLLILINALLTSQYINILYCPLIGYGFAWIGHFRFEKNRPATFKYPLYSFAADFVMWWQLITKKIYF